MKAKQIVASFFIKFLLSVSVATLLCLFITGELNYYFRWPSMLTFIGGWLLVSQNKTSRFSAILLSGLFWAIILFSIGAHVDLEGTIFRVQLIAGAALAVALLVDNRFIEDYYYTLFPQEKPRTVSQTVQRVQLKTEKQPDPDVVIASFLASIEKQEILEQLAPIPQPVKLDKSTGKLVWGSLQDKSKSVHKPKPAQPVQTNQSRPAPNVWKEQTPSYNYSPPAPTYSAPEPYVSQYDLNRAVQDSAKQNRIKDLESAVGLGDFILLGSGEKGSYEHQANKEELERLKRGY